MSHIGSRLRRTGRNSTKSESPFQFCALADVFYIGGTKAGALFGEVVTFPKPGIVPRFHTLTKQHGAMLTKARILGIQLDKLFTDGLYERIAHRASAREDRIRATRTSTSRSRCSNAGACVTPSILASGTSTKRVVFLYSHPLSRGQTQENNP